MAQEDLNILPDIVASIETFENKAAVILQKLVEKFPKSSRVLRAYGTFTEEIQKDTEKAKRLYRQADEVEEEKTKKHR